LDGGEFVFERTMHPFGVVPHKIVHEFSIEGIRRAQVGDMIVHKLILDRAIESLNMGVHLRGLGIGVVVDEMEATQFCIKVFHKLAPIVGEHKGNGKWKDREAQIEKVLGGTGRMRGGFPCEAEAREDVLERDDVISPAPDVFLDGIECDTVPRILRREIQWFSQDFLTIDHLDLAEVGHFLGVPS